MLYSESSGWRHGLAATSMRMLAAQLSSAAGTASCPRAWADHGRRRDGGHGVDDPDRPVVRGAAGQVPCVGQVGEQRADRDGLVFRECHGITGLQPERGPAPVV